MERKIHKINNYLKKIYNNNNTIDMNSFLDILYDEKLFYIINKSDQLNITGIEDDENFFPNNGILSIEIDNIINFYEKLNENDINKIDINNIPTNVINSANILMLSVIHGINLYKFDYNKEDLDEIVCFINMYNNIDKFVNIDNPTLLFMFKKYMNIDDYMLLSLFLEKIDNNKEVIITNKNLKKFKKTNDEILKFKNNNIELFKSDIFFKNIGKIPITKNTYI